MLVSVAAAAVVVVIIVVVVVNVVGISPSSKLVLINLLKSIEYECNAVWLLRLDVAFNLIFRISQVLWRFLLFLQLVLFCCFRVSWHIFFAIIRKIRFPSTIILIVSIKRKKST